MTKLIFGCGYLGERVARRWLAEGEQVFAVTRSGDRAERWAAEGLTPIIADVMRREYQAIVEAGFILQLDCPDLAMLRHMVYLDLPLKEFRKIIAVNVAALNHAVRDLPPDRMRMHVCWGSTMAPRHTDVPLRDIVDIVLTALPQAVSFPAANGAHEHEWKIWREVKLPPGKIVIPGVIDSTSNTVEHPDLTLEGEQVPRT